MNNTKKGVYSQQRVCTYMSVGAAKHMKTNNAQHELTDIIDMKGKLGEGKFGICVIRFTIESLHCTSNWQLM